LKLRGRATILFGKNTLVRAGLKRRMTKPVPEDEDYEIRNATWYDKPELQQLYDILKLNVGMVFCHSDMSAVNEVVEGTSVAADAKAGVIAPLDVFVSAGPTGMGPDMTKFFQALGIGTKIMKGQIDILSD
jgi:large subunit ribosomal protein LP0